MRAAASVFTGYTDDRPVALLAVVVLGCGSILAFGGAASGGWSLAAAGAIAAGAALVVLLVADWVPALLLVTLSLPLPAPFSSEQLRVAPAALTTAAVLIGWLAQRAVDRRGVDRPSVPRSAWALFVAVTLSTAFAQHPLFAIRELANWVLLLGLFVVAMDVCSRRASMIRSVARALAAAGGVTGMLAALESLGVLPADHPHWGTSLNRAALGFGGPTELAMFFALTLPFGVYCYSTAHGLSGRLVGAANLGALALGLAATFSRGSWLASVAGTAVFLCVGERRLVLRVCIALLVGGLAVDFASGGALSDRILGTAEDPLVGQRAALTLTGLLMFAAYPVLGVGPGGFGKSLEDFGPQISWLWHYSEAAHNGYVHMAAETGIIGVGALFLFLRSGLSVLLRLGRRSDPGTGLSPEQVWLRRAMLWSFSTACAVGVVEWPFAHGIGQIVMLVIAMGFAMAKHARDEIVCTRA